jgi:hypothetical protein
MITVAERGLAFSTLAMTVIERMIVRGVCAERRFDVRIC